MTGRIEKTVFLSYRRTNMPWALAIYQHLADLGYDVFFDYNSIKSGDFEQIITQNVKGRAHFLVLLTPSALERCNEPGDWLRREIELALDEKRNIVPLFFEGFSFSSLSVSKYLTGKLELLKKYNGMTVPAEYFDAAMARLCNDFLNIRLSAVLHPISITVERAVKDQQSAASNATKIQQTELTAQQWYEKGRASIDLNEQIRFYTEAIQLKPDFASAYAARGLAHKRNGNIYEGIADTIKAILSQPRYDLGYYNLACFEAILGNSDMALVLLKVAVDLDNINSEMAQNDLDLVNIYDDPRFKKIVGR